MPDHTTSRTPLVAAIPPPIGVSPITAPVVWIASYPRSGNTMLRTVIFQCFGVRSASVYQNDLGGQKGLEGYVGHIEHGADGSLPFGDEPVRLIKTHAPPQDERKTIYVIRNGRDATLSYFRFLKGRVPLIDLIEGRQARSWASHIDMWQPLTRPDTLLVRYEDLVDDLAATVDQVGDFLGLEPRRHDMPSRASLVDGRWIRPAGDENVAFDAACEAAFDRVDGAAMQLFGYT